MKKIILASSSRWRRDIFAKTGIPFTVEESGYEEDIRTKLPPERLVKKFALAKALAVAGRHPRALVIGADTVLVRVRHVLGKPRTKTEAAAMLRRWSGKSGRALTGIAIVDATNGEHIVRVAETRIYFRKLSAREIAAYVKTDEPMSGAGAFTIMKGGASFVRRIEGDFYNIAGLPLALLVEELKKFNVRVNVHKDYKSFLNSSSVKSACLMICFSNERFTSRPCIGTEVTSFFSSCQKYKWLPRWPSSTNPARFNAPTIFRAFRFGNLLICAQARALAHQPRR